MAATSALVACTEAVKRDTEEEMQEMTVPKKPGPITKVPATLTCNGGEEFTFSVTKVQWADTYEWTIAEQEKSKISIVDGQGTNVITVKVVNDDVVIPAQSVSVVAKNELGTSKVREYFAAITVSVPIELPGYSIRKYGKRWWMTENCHEAGEDGRLGVAPDLTAFSVSGLEASHLARLDAAKLIATPYTPEGDATAHFIAKAMASAADDNHVTFLKADVILCVAFHDKFVNIDGGDILSVAYQLNVSEAADITHAACTVKRMEDGREGRKGVGTRLHDFSHHIDLDSTDIT